MSVTLADQIACLEREIKMRERVYPSRIQRGEMTPVTALREIERMKAVLETLQKLDAVESLFPPEEAS